MNNQANQLKTQETELVACKTHPNRHKIQIVSCALYTLYDFGLAVLFVIFVMFQHEVFINISLYAYFQEHFEM